MRVCSVSGCEKKHYGKGFCSAHYTRKLRYGDTSIVHSTARRYPSPVERIAQCTTLTPDGCREYRPPRGGKPTRSGHIHFVLGGTKMLVHRAAWIIAYGPIPDELVVRHSCDNPPCVELSHLLLGTVADNNRDRDERGRHKPLPGSQNGFSKLTEDRVLEIRHLLSKGQSQRSIAQRFGVSQSAVYLIGARKTWSHI